MIEHKELYGNRNKDPSASLTSSIHTDSRFLVPNKQCDDSPTAVVKAIESANVSDAVRDVLLHSREMTMSDLPQQMGRIADWDEVKDAVVAYEVSKGLPPTYDRPYPLPPDRSASSTSPASCPLLGQTSPDSAVSSLSPGSILGLRLMKFTSSI